MISQEELKALLEQKDNSEGIKKALEHLAILEGIRHDLKHAEEYDVVFDIAERIGLDLKG